VRECVTSRMASSPAMAVTVERLQSILQLHCGALEGAPVHRGLGRAASGAFLTWTCRGAGQATLSACERVVILYKCDKRFNACSVCVKGSFCTASHTSSMPNSLPTAKVVAHMHETTDPEQLRLRGVSRERIKAWEGRAMGTSDYHFWFPANDMDAVKGGATVDEVNTMRWLVSKGCTLEQGTMAAHFFPGRAGVDLKRIFNMAKHEPPLPADARLQMPRHSGAARRRCRRAAVHANPRRAQGLYRRR